LPAGSLPAWDVAAILLYLAFGPAWLARILLSYRRLGGGRLPATSFDTRGGHRGASFLEIDEFAQRELLEIAAGPLYPSGVGDASRLDWVEPGGTDQTLSRGRGRVVVCGVEEHSPSGRESSKLRSR
jgi:hypothetical protein